MENLFKQYRKVDGQKVRLSIFDIKDHVPSVRKPLFSSYDNKPISKWDDDDFAGYVFDMCHEEHLKNEKGEWIVVYTLAAPKDSFLWLIHYLEYIPSYHTRVYLYGVWSCVKEVIIINKEVK